MAHNIPLEPFPAAAARQFIIQEDTTISPDARPRRRRKSSGLPGEPRGDTGAAALSTISTADHNAPPSPIDAPAGNQRRKWKRRKAKSLFRRWKSISLRHTWLNPLIICLAVLSYYAWSPGPQNFFYPAIFLSYPLPRKAGEDPSAPIQYGKGGLDFAFVAFYTVVLSFTREFIMQRILRPLAQFAGIKSRAKQSRFMEQAYTALYFGILGPFGLYVMSRSPVWYFNTTGMYEGFPHRQHEGLFKAYYLVQASYWTQQAVVLILQLEKPRKDFKELVAHHIITIALIWCSYRFHFTYMGLAVYITHDISDFFLATSKILNYLDSPITAPFFGFFMFVWAYLRHYLNLRLIYSVLTDFRTIGPFELNWETQQYKCWISQYITFALLASLQSVNCFWFFLILRIAKRIIFDDDIRDDRSDDGSDEEVVEAETTEEKRKRMDWPAEGANGEAVLEEKAPVVLLNGAPVVESKVNGVKKVEVRATQQRRKKA